MNSGESDPDPGLNPSLTTLHSYLQKKGKVSRKVFGEFFNKMTNSGNWPGEEMGSPFSFTSMTDAYLKMEFLLKDS